MIHVDRVRRVLENLKQGDCWCEAGIGNPMLQGRHTPRCRAAQALLNDLREPTEVDPTPLEDTH